jgi:hypothetical protein
LEFDGKQKCRVGMCRYGIERYEMTGVEFAGNGIWRYELQTWNLQVLENYGTFGDSYNPTLVVRPIVIESTAAVCTLGTYSVHVGVHFCIDFKRV